MSEQDGKHSWQQDVRAEWHRQPVTALSAAVATLLVVGSVVVQWGLADYRLALMEARQSEDRALLAALAERNAGQDARLAVLEARLDGIEANALAARIAAEESLRLLRYRNSGGGVQR